MNKKIVLLYYRMHQAKEVEDEEGQEGLSGLGIWFLLLLLLLLLVYSLPLKEHTWASQHLLMSS